MVENSGAVFAYTDKNNNLVAFARVLTDFVFKGLILDVVVEKEYRDKGIGSKLIKEIMNDSKLKKVKCLELYCKNEVIPFYDKFGFKKVEGDMHLMERI